MAIVFVRHRGGKLERVGETQERGSGFSNEAYANSISARRASSIADVRRQFLGSGPQIGSNVRLSARRRKRK